ncbi:WYL domain-containing protein [Actinomarinicola tropica]|uniref:WYL domain-containing protein n=1 Tax=Actinomarinicola tropica TaxID=2789776 RepID=A0A5Q2RJQ2_9ACTN|nr:WYL domain-containing protein [Actinomarinicola tropica]
MLQLLSLLQTYRFWPGTELSDRLGISSRTLRRDIDRLRVLGYPVDATPGAAGGYRLAAGSHMPPLLLDDDEAVAIAVGLRAAAGASIDGIEEISVRALAKLEQVLPDRLRRRVRTVHANIVPMRWDGGPGPTVVPEALALLSQACRDHEEARFDYRRRDGEESSRLVQPHHLVSAGRRWYLVAWDVRRDDWRTFRLDRVVEPRLAGARFTPRSVPGGGPAEFVARSIADMPVAHHVVVRATCTAEEVASLLRWVDADVEDLGATCRVALRGEEPAWLAMVIAGLATAVDVELEEDLSGAVGPCLAAVGRRLSRATPGPSRGGG